MIQSKDNNLYYCTLYQYHKDPLNQKYSKAFIDIVPLHKTKFDVVSLIQFLDCITEDYICINKSIYSQVISLNTKLNLIYQLKIILRKLM